MRKYTLASPTARHNVDLRDHRETIGEAVHKVMPTATVQVEHDYYCVSPTPTQGEAIRIGRLICQSPLSKNCIQIPKLFTSTEVGKKKKEEKPNGTKNSKRIGGHH